MTARTLPSAPTPQYGAPNLPITTTRRTAMDTATIPTEDEFAQRLSRTIDGDGLA